MTLVAASLALLLGAAPAAAQEPQAEQCLDPQVCPIPYVRLSKQETEPFLFIGEVVDVNHPRYGEYKKAIRRFLNVRSCLNDDEREKPRPDLRKIDWKAIKNSEEIEVCIFHIGSSIEDVKIILLWLQYHGFIVHKIPRELRGNYVQENGVASSFNLQSFLSIREFRKIIPQAWPARIIGLEWGTSYALTLSFSKTYQLICVHSRVRTVTQE